MLVAGLQSLSLLSVFYSITRTDGKVSITAEHHPGSDPILVRNITFYKPGQRLSLRCTSDNPGVTLTWTRNVSVESDNAPKLVIPSGGAFEFNPIKTGDGGIYHCAGSDSLGDHFILRVLHADSLKADNVTTNGTDGRVYLFCDQSHFNTTFPVKWRYDNFSGDLNSIPEANHTFWVDTKDKKKKDRLVVFNPHLERYPSKTGRYTCELDIPGLDPPISKSMYYFAKPDVRFHDANTLGESSKGDDYELTCVFNGHKSDSVKWIRIMNDTYNETLFDYTDTRIACADAASTKTVCKSSNNQRIRLKRNEELEEREDLKKQLEHTSVLVVKNISEHDRAEYRCYVSNEHGELYAKQFIRVRDKMAALWPFLGIIAELAFLGLVIFLCDRRRSKHVEEEDQVQPMLDQDATRNQDAAREVSLRNRK